MVFRSNSRGKQRTIKRGVVPTKNEDIIAAYVSRFREKNPLTLAVCILYFFADSFPRKSCVTGVNNITDDGGVVKVENYVYENS